MNYKVGFSRVNITPPLGIHLCGYFFDRLADSVRDELEINAIAFDDGENRAVLLVLDAEGVHKAECDIFRAAAAERTGLPAEAIFITCTHTHTAPFAQFNHESELVREYAQFLKRKLADAAQLALDDLKPAEVSYGTVEAKGISFVRRYRMKDGTSQTNPTVGDPNIVEPIGTADEREHIIRFDRQGADTVLLVNFGVHPDTIGGCGISADYPGFLRQTVEKALPGTKCLFINGAQGDVNHVNPKSVGGQAIGMHRDFDCPRGYDHAKHMGYVLAGGVLQIYEKMTHIELGKLHTGHKTVHVPSNRPAPEEMPLAKKYHELHTAGKDEEIPYTGMELTTVVAGAARKVRLEHGPDFFEIDIYGLALGQIALIGFPGEPFTDISTTIKAADDDFAVIMTCVFANGSEGYFPMFDTFAEGGYEAASCPFKAGVGELLANEGIALLKSMKD